MDNTKEEAAIKDKQKGKVWNEDLGHSLYAKVKGQNSCSLCLPTGAVEAGGTGMAPLRKKGDTGVSHQHQLKGQCKQCAGHMWAAERVVMNKHISRQGLQTGGG